MTNHDTSVKGCGAHEEGHPHTAEGLRLIREHGAVHVSGTHYRIGPPLPGHWDYDAHIAAHDEHSGLRGRHPHHPNGDGDIAPLDPAITLRHYALVDKGYVSGVAVVDPTTIAGTSWLVAVTPLHDLVEEVDLSVSAGHKRNADGSYSPPSDEE